MALKYTTKSIIQRFENKHGNRYDYNLVNFIGIHDKVKIICKKHGDFLQSANSHARGNGCPRCSAEDTIKRKRSTTEEFINKAVNIHKDIYGYNYVEYINIDTPIKIICKKHGAFHQTPDAHLSGKGCSICGMEKAASSRRLSKESFLELAPIIHDNKYDYSLVKYRTRKEKVKIICPVHGVFEQIPQSHLKGYGCQRCATEGNKFKERYDSKEPAILYYVKLLVNDKQYYKIGVTTRTIQERFRQENNPDLIIIPIKEEYFEFGKDAYTKELNILQEHRSDLTKDTGLLKSGGTEIFSRDVLNLDN